MITFGIDCGLTGAIAALDQRTGEVRVEDLPVMIHGAAKWIDAEEMLRIVRELREGRPARAVVEQVHAMPKLGVVAANSKGLTMGSLLAALQIAGVSIEFVAPTTWKRDLGLLAPKASDREKKHASLCKARLLFPTAELTRAKDHGRAEALLIAHWAVRRLDPFRGARSGEIDGNQQVTRV